MKAVGILLAELFIMVVPDRHARSLCALKGGVA